MVFEWYWIDYCDLQPVQKLIGEGKNKKIGVILDPVLAVFPHNIILLNPTYFEFGKRQIEVEIRSCQMKVTSTQGHN